MSEISFEDRVAIITGAGGGLGKTYALEFARRGATASLEMIFRDGFYHADPHPGNILLMKDNVVGVLDGGMVARIDEGLRDEIEALR